MNTSQPEDNSQDEGRKFTPQQLFLIGLLGVVFVVVIVVSILILNRPQSLSQQLPTEQQEIILSTEIVRSLTPTNTITPSPRATFTPKPTWTQTQSPTFTETPLPTLLPSITPAYPSEHNDQYELVLWTPELANQLIDILEVYPDTLSSFARGDDSQGYYDAFQYAQFAQREALLRFPSAPQANTWQWQLAYNLARTGDPTAGEVYANLITQELNRENTSLDELYVWGLKQDPELLIESFLLEPGDNEISSHLVKVTAEDNGSTYFWLIEISTGYSSFSLTSDFDFINPNTIDHFVENSLGSGGEVVGIFPTRIHGSLHYKPPSTFGLITQPPELLPFSLFSPPAIGPAFTNNWQPIQVGDEPGDLQFTDVIFPACPVTVRHFYDWNGLEFLFLEDIYQISPDPDLLSYCDYVVNHSINVWGLEPTIQLMETLLPIWPPETTATGKDYAEDGLDEWRYRLSIYHALLANQDQAVEYSQLILDEPSSPDSNWIEPAADLITHYQTQRDIYRVCLKAEFCNHRLGFQSLIETISNDEYPDLINILKQAGVDLRSRGFFDFDNSGEPEQWVVIRHQTGSPQEFWIISPNETFLDAVYVTTVSDNTPGISYFEPISEPPIVVLDTDITFYYILSGPENEPVIVFVEPEVIYSSDVTEQELDNLEEVLLSGGDPVYVQDELIILRESPHFTCSFLLCPRFLYLLGLASELANDDFSAVAAYLDLWRDYPGHPYTIMARFKLGSTFEPTPTPLPTSLATPMPSLPTATPNPTFTPTTEGYPPPGYPPPGSIPTNTPPPNPYPYPTP